MNKQKIVILGGGYGGLQTVVKLQKSLSPNEAEIILVNNHPYHYETTWLHEAAAGTLQPERVRYSIEDIIDQRKVQFVQDTVEKIIPEEKKVQLGTRELSYDYLVVALGAEAETFGIKGLKEHAFTISNLDSARKIKEHIEYVFSTYHSDGRNTDEQLSIVVGGAGFTGIEFLGELVNRIPKLCDTYQIKRENVKVYCIEAAPTVLPGFDPELVKYAKSVLEKKGVEFLIGTPIKECTKEGVLVDQGNGETKLIKANTVVWAAGVRGNSVIEKSGFENVRARVAVDSYLRAPGYDDVFIIGDCSAVINKETNRPYPPTAQIAMQQGKLVAKNLKLLLQGKKDLETFVFDNKGTVCSLGEDDAVGIVFGKKITGFKASFMKKVIDNRSLFLIGGTSLVLKKGKLKLF
ncbi:NAD(P)/FAD-dependent oxidoreductase [Fervidibacillus halotolerans]|uniref:NAD(P)/FAD-dependent oxidoreductase n=1 Tax=Fervidibacillus halotolerans TaxID=2980027 RepID=A0A9E8LZ08_9BACI|nr:NAD(P)/FAD-dependent oxidoreductase [Fervidibacillus halotolerans]WAA11885.1 NAD(P)/FAD-dependent oxidoreductase [Fervidibacillus halotolerans]